MIKQMAWLLDEEQIIEALRKTEASLNRNLKLRKISVITAKKKATGEINVQSLRERIRLLAPQPVVILLRRILSVGIFSQYHLSH